MRNQRTRRKRWGWLGDEKKVYHCDIFMVCFWVAKFTFKKYKGKEQTQKETDPQ